MTQTKSSRGINSDCLMRGELDHICDRGWDRGLYRQYVKMDPVIEKLDLDHTCDSRSSTTDVVDRPNPNSAV